MTNEHPTAGKAEQKPRPLRRIPVLQEVLHLGKRIVETGRGVRLRKKVTEETVRIDDTLTQQELEIEHVPRGEWVKKDALPGSRYEGSTLVVLVLEEVLVVEKRWRLNEEIRITAKSNRRPLVQRVVLRKENVAIERFDESGGTSDLEDPSAK